MDVSGQGITTTIFETSDKNLLESVDRSSCLGSTVTSTLSLHEEIIAGIGKAATTFGKLSKRPWNNKWLTLTTKVSIYQICVRSPLLYGSETWTAYARLEEKASYLCCLHRVVNTKWQDTVTNSEVRQCADLSISDNIKQQKLEMTGTCKKNRWHPCSQAASFLW